MAGSILIATDGSPASRSAIEVGLRLAQAEESSVLFVHAEALLSEQLFLDNPNQRDDLETLLAADPALRGAAELARGRGVSFDVELVGEHGSSRVADAIVGLATGVGSTMIVMGARGRGAVAGTLLGSVSQDVLKAAAVPVVIVHSGGAAGELGRPARSALADRALDDRDDPCPACTRALQLERERVHRKARRVRQLVEIREPLDLAVLLLPAEKV